MTNIRNKIYGLSGIFISIYIAAAFLAPVDQEVLTKFNISEGQLRLMTLPILLMVVAIWLFTAYGFMHFKQYAAVIKGSPDGKGINTLANGLGVIALQLVITSLFSSLAEFDSIKNSLGGKNAVLIMTTYLSLILSLLGYYLLAQGARQLKSTVAKTTKKQNKAWVAGLLLLAVVYIGIMMTNYPANTSDDSIYHLMTLPAAILLLAIPQIIVWYLALSTATDLVYYESRVSGVIYKSALKYFARGIYMIVGSTIFIQMLGVLGGVLKDLKLAPLLIIVYLFILAFGVGFLFIAQSAKKLRKIEEL